ncbi:MAG: hypothetical protein ACOYWZ_17675 [Bacillota bacterium]
MREKLEGRINQLKAELESGQKLMEELDTKRTSLGYTVLRISGAIQVLEELLAKED